MRKVIKEISDKAYIGKLTREDINIAFQKLVRIQTAIANAKVLDHKHLTRFNNTNADILALRQYCLTYLDEELLPPFKRVKITL